MQVYVLNILTTVNKDHLGLFSQIFGSIKSHKKNVEIQCLCLLKKIYTDTHLQNVFPPQHVYCICSKYWAVISVKWVIILFLTGSKFNLFLSH